MKASEIVKQLSAMIVHYDDCEVESYVNDKIVKGIGVTELTTGEKVFCMTDGNNDWWEIYKNNITEIPDVRSHNVGNSDYSKHKIQPWDIWNEYRLNPFDADIVKRVLRHKKGDSRKMDYEKIIHICQERIRQIDNNEDVWSEE